MGAVRSAPDPTPTLVPSHAPLSQRGKAPVRHGGGGLRRSDDAPAGVFIRIPYHLFRHDVLGRRVSHATAEPNRLRLRNRPAPISPTKALSRTMTRPRESTTLGAPRTAMPSNAL